MKNLSLFLLLCLLFAACAKDENKEPILVTDIVMPTQTSFNPGDKVTIKAQGFQTDDDIMFEIYWPLPDQPAMNYQGYALGVSPVMVEQTSTSITFLAPGHYPASTTKVRLRRSGDIMTLGEIAVTNGEAPKEFQLYGIVNSHSSTGYNNCIEHVNLTNGTRLCQNVGTTFFYNLSSCYLFFCLRRFFLIHLVTSCYLPVVSGYK